MKNKKVLFLQNEGKIYGGVWQVNKLVGEELLKRNYQVSVVSIRNNPSNIETEHNPKLEVFTINEKELWGTYSGREIIKELTTLHIFKSLKMVITKIKYLINFKKDIKKLHNYIHEYNPDYIITSQYQLIDMIPKDYLNKTIHEQHTSFKDAKNHRATINTFKKYNNKIKFLWLTKKTMEDAKKFGLNNNSYIYNAVRFKTEKITNTDKNKKLITIARLSEQKRIDIMIDIVKSIFEDKKYKEWCLEIYGTGELEEELRKQINNHKQILLMGITNNPQKELLDASINLNTSSFEGFSLSILEANECGVPTVTLDFGESVEEEILNNKTGIIAENIDDYKEKLKELMNNKEKLKEFSKNAKEFSKSFQIENIVEDWIDLFKEIDKRKGE